jgi:hypothetical protein
MAVEQLWSNRWTQEKAGVPHDRLDSWDIQQGEKKGTKALSPVCKGRIKSESALG